MKSCQKMLIFHSKSQWIWKILIHGFHSSRKWWNMKSRLHLIHVNSYHRIFCLWRNSLRTNCSSTDCPRNKLSLDTPTQVPGNIEPYIGLIYTVCKFHDFSITQILREINFRDFRSAKSAIWTHLEALNFDVYEFLHFLKAEI